MRSWRAPSESGRALLVTVWYAEPIDSSRCDPLLDVSERVRSALLARRDDRHRFATGRLLAKTLVAQRISGTPMDVVLELTCEQCGVGRHGKPRIADDDSGLELSIAHSHRRVVAAVAAGTRIGIDVQHVKALGNVTSLAGRVLSPTELSVFSAIEPAQQQRALLTYWVRKEALLKATGHGLTVPLSAVTMSRSDEPARLVQWEARPPAPVAAALADIMVGAEYVACVAALVSEPIRLEVSNVTSTFGSAAQEWVGEPSVQGGP